MATSDWKGRGNIGPQRGYRAERLVEARILCSDATSSSSADYLTLQATGERPCQLCIEGIPPS